jgi:hypothetical protein
MSWAFQPLLPGAAQQQAATPDFVDAEMFSAGSAAVQAVGDGGLPDELPQGLDDIIAAAGGAMRLHPDLLGLKKKKKKEQAAREAEAAARASAQAESDFRILLEAVRIRDNAERLTAVKRKRAAMMADLENAALIRQSRAA